MNSQIKLEIADLLCQLVSAQRTVDRLEQLGYKQKTVRENLSMLIDGVLEQVQSRIQGEGSIYAHKTI